MSADPPRLSLWSHAQTLSAALPFRPGPPRGLHTQVVELPIPEGGDLVAVATWQNALAPAVVVLHGVSGSCDDPYVVRAAHGLLQQGFHVLRLNGRGSGRGTGKALRLYHAGMAEDVALAVRFLAARADVTRVGALGFSLGGHLALTHAADVSSQTGNSGRLAAVVTVSAPVDLEETADAFDAGRSGLVGVYERLMVRSLLDKGRALLDSSARKGRSLPYSQSELERVTTIRGFDSLVTVRCHGFADARDYYTRMSVGRRLPDIRIPTLMIHAGDDPIVPARALERTPRSSDVDVVISERGGHVGFVEGLSQLWGTTAAVARATEHFQRHLRDGP